jgi:hypothetical protein
MDKLLHFAVGAGISVVAGLVASPMAGVVAATIAGAVFLVLTAVGAYAHFLRQGTA